jgi:hypothetical protein
MERNRAMTSSEPLDPAVTAVLALNLHKLIVFPFVALGFELRASHLLGGGIRIFERIYKGRKKSPQDWVLSEGKKEMLFCFVLF